MTVTKLKHYRMTVNTKGAGWYFVAAETIHDAITAVEAATHAYVNFGTEVHRTEPKHDETVVEV